MPKRDKRRGIVAARLLKNPLVLEAGLLAKGVAHGRNGKGWPALASVGHWWQAVAR
jgi:hypothetical protein